MILGVTGHQDLPADVTARVADGVADLLTKRDVDVVVSCLARGADQLVARAVRSHGGTLDAVVPCRGYDELFEGADRDDYDELLAGASRVTRLPFPVCSEEAFLAGGLVVVERCDLLVAIWDGAPARGLGGTADVVAHARDLVEVERIW